jgi:hypothetical protein
MPAKTAELELILEKDREELDPELLQLPDPPRKERRATLALLAVTAAAALAMVVALRRDAAYAFAPQSSTDLGDLRVASAQTFAPNRYVEGHGMLAAAGALRYERPFESDSYRIAPVAGQPKVWVEVRVPAGEENARYVPKTAFSGRMIPFRDVGPRHRGLRTAIADETGQGVPEDAWLVIDDQPPSSSRWAVTLVALFGIFALWNLGAMWKLTRRVK